MSSYIIPVRYGLMAATEIFTAESDDFHVGDEVIVKTSRGIDVGEAMAKPRLRAQDDEPEGELLRPANEADHSILGHIRESKEPEEFATCQQCIRERQLPMRLVGVEHLFSGDKIIFYFLAENRVDFRELVKELARRYRTRIEMRQIGVRDEARLLADYEHCGRELCCRTFIRNLEPVTMRMAKMQKTTLDPSKISGHCGRLMCCLRFEDEVYSALQAEMPARGAVCVTEHFTGEVVSYDMFRREIQLVLPDGSQEVVHISAIREIQGRRGNKNANQLLLQVRNDPVQSARQNNARYPGRDGAKRQPREETTDDAAARPAEPRRTGKGNGRNPGGTRSNNAGNDAEGPGGNE